MRKMALEILIDHNKNIESPITRLFYSDKGDYVEDFSVLVDKEVIDKETLAVFQDSENLTLEQEEEKNKYVIEGDLGALTRKYLNTDLRIFTWKNPINREERGF